MREWLLWSVGLITVCSAVAVAWVFTSGSGDVIGAGVYALMTIVAVACFVRSFSTIKYIETEKRIAIEQVDLMSATTDFDEFFRKSKEGLFRQHIHDLFLIAETHSEVDQEPLIESIHARLLSRNRFVELFSGILVTLGLIGTIVGLIFMMGGLGETVVAHGTDGTLLTALFSKNADGSASGPMAGLGFAFYTTLIGSTLGGVVFRVLTSVVDENIEDYVSELRTLTHVHVLPLLRKIASAKIP
jgi:MotA/TolQ/ExbB proton channel family